MEQLETGNDPAGAQSRFTAMLGVIKAASDSSKARIWAQLNRHDWPEELSHLKPPTLDTMGSEAQHMIAWGLMNVVMGAIGIKECLREWNKDTMPGTHFDDWWNNGRHRLTSR